MSGLGSVHTSRWIVTATLLWLVGVNACSKEASGVTRCIDSDPACGAACNSSHPCGSGLYCGADSLCGKDCTSTQGCGTGQRCGSTGRCEPGAAVSGGSGAGGSAGQASAAGRGGSAPIKPPARPMSGDDSGAPNATDCQTAMVSSTRVIPTVVLVIDQSGSMTTGFTGGSRWNVLRDFLLRSDGLIASLETQIRFGLAMYSAQQGDQECPLVTSVAPMLMNFGAIDTAYRAAQPLGETPTGDSIDKIVEGLPKPGLDDRADPVVLILATDGEPDRCEELNPQNGQAEAVAAVERAFALGIRTYIISVGEEVTREHQQAVANAGLGRVAGDAPAPYWTAGDDVSLRMALTEIISAQISCDVKLEGTVQGGNPCDGTVELNGTKLACNGADGWTLLDKDHIRLTGKACTDFKSLRDASVNARFPCSVPVLL